MAHKDFKTLYKSEYTSQGALINEVFPDEVRVILALIKGMEMGDISSPDFVLAWLCSNLPPYQKFFKDYDKLKEELEECRKLKELWITDTQRRQFPLLLKKKLYYLYERWWEAYNESGAGIRSIAVDPSRDSKVYAYLTGKSIK